jgi:hypothetical protein
MNEKLAGEVESIRAQIAALKEQRTKLRSAFVPKSVALSRVDDHVERLAERGRQSQLGYYASPDGNDPLILVGETREDFAALIAWLDPGKLKARLRADVTKLYAGIDDEVGDDERNARLSEISAELFELEKREEIAIVTAERAGILINRRHDVDARAIVAAAMES